MASHQTEKTTIKTADIDIGIIPVIKWLNSFDFIYTTHCCEGDNKEQPYVTFVRTQHLNWFWGPIINKIIDKLAPYGEFTLDRFALEKFGNKDYIRIERDAFSPFRTEEYHFLFNDVESLKNFIEKELE